MTIRATSFAGVKAGMSAPDSGDLMPPLVKKWDASRLGHACPTKDDSHVAERRRTIAETQGVG